MKKLIFLLGPFFLGGCASTLTAWKADPIQIYEMKRTNSDDEVASSVYTLTGERRTAVVINNQDGKQIFCAESLPDAASAFGGTSSIKAKPKEIDVDISDEFDMTLTQTFTRTEAAELYRQMAWNTCLAWAQGALTTPQYQQMLSAMVDGGLKYMEASAKPPK